MRRPDWLLEHASDTFSQNGEDGVIAKILSLLDSRDHWCVEFGAWDGVHLSNVRRLILEEGYSAVLIEGDRAKFAELRHNYAGNERVVPLNAMVGFQGEEGLDGILAPYPIPETFDFLSIDIDGNDYHVWRAIEVSPDSRVRGVQSHGSDRGPLRPAPRSVRPPGSEPALPVRSGPGERI
jgi:hypothetical protein